MRPIYYIIGYQGENQILTPSVKVRFIHNWVIMNIQWMMYWSVRVQFSDNHGYMLELGTWLFWEL
jgi:hypothetical protein